MMHPARLEDDALLAQCRVGKTRSSGPGGQHRNKVETKVVLTHEPTGLLAQAGERRSAVENQHVAVFRLRLALAVQVRCPVPAGECRSELWLERCKGGRIACNPEHRDFPSMLAEALDVLTACKLDPGKAGLRLGCSASQLVKLLKDHPHAFERWNRERVERGLRPLR